MELNACLVEEETVVDLYHSYCTQLWLRDECVVQFVLVMRYF
jgi:hypothetical protein